MKNSLLLSVSFSLIMMHAQYSLADLDMPLTDMVNDVGATNKNSRDNKALKKESKRDYQFFPEAIVLSGREFSIGASMGPYRVVTDPKSLSLKSQSSTLAKTALTPAKIVVRGSRAGRLGLADGEMIIKLVYASDREVILQQYGLNLISVSPSGSFFTARVVDITDLQSVFIALLANPLVKEADLNVNYFDQVPN